MKKKMETKSGKSNSQWYGTVARLIAGAPLFFFGWMKLLNEGTQTNFMATLKLASIPVPEVAFWLAALNEIIAGALLISGWKGQVGAVLAIAQMIVALYVHITVDFSQTPAGGPPHWLPVLVLVCALIVLFKGFGKFSIAKSVG